MSDPNVRESGRTLRLGNASAIEPAPPPERLEAVSPSGMRVMVLERDRAEYEGLGYTIAQPSVKRETAAQPKPAQDVRPPRTKRGETKTQPGN